MNTRRNRSAENKLLICKHILKSAWAYGWQMWEYANKTNVNKIHKFHNKVPREIFDTLWYVRNIELNGDPGMPTINEEIKNLTNARKHERSCMSV